MKYLIVTCLLIAGFSCKEKPKQAIQKKEIYYTCSMHPQIVRQEPGKCPICGMELVAVTIGEGKSGGTIILSDQQVQLGNIRVDTIGRNDIGDKMVLTAILNMDESKTVTINARIAGRIEKMYVKSTGAYLHKGDRLYDLYSEELNNAKQEYLLAIEKQKTLDNSIIDFRQVVESSRNKLLLWGMSASQISDLEKTKNSNTYTSFYSPADGYITMQESHEGDYVSEGTTILRVASLSELWAEAQVYSSQLSQIDRRSTATVKLPELEKEINGRIEFVNPEINPATRINLIRVVIPNTGGLLKPGMPAYVILKNRQSNTLTLPSEAVIRNEKGSLVWLSAEHNLFKTVRIKTGFENDDRVEIDSGLNPGDRVVISGAYLLNSEFIIRYGSGPMP